MKYIASKLQQRMPMQTVLTVDFAISLCGICSTDAFYIVFLLQVLTKHNNSASSQKLMNR